jgi:hypothetical protein
MDKDMQLLEMLKAMALSSAKSIVEDIEDEDSIAELECAISACENGTATTEQWQIIIDHISL